MTPLTAIAQLRHLYNLSGHGGIYPSDVRNLLTPVIEALEAAHTPAAPDPSLGDANRAANAIIAQQADEAKALQDEIDRLKTGIKTSQLTMIVDGGDMADWGWERQRSGGSAAVVVKLLVWHRFGLSHHHARHAGVTVFSVERRPDHYWLDFAPASKQVSQSTHPTLEAAQAAAQEQWEIFVRGALQP